MSVRPNSAGFAAPFRDFALETYFSRWEFKARCNLAGSDPETLTLNELLALGTEEDRRAFGDMSLGYTETWGAPALRRTIAATYETMEPEDILCFAGAEEPIYIAARVLLSKDDHAIIVTPGYQSAETIALSICPVTAVPLDPERNWELDVDRIRDAIRPNTRLLSINFPNNPTGHVIPRESLDALVTLCREHGIWLFSDEVYRRMERRPEDRLPQVADLYERGISLNVLTKAYGLPALRIGWLGCRDRDFLERCERYKHYLSICNAGPSELLADIALRAADTITARIREITDANLVVLEDFFARHRDLFDWQVPKGGCIGFIRYRGADGVEAFTARLVEETGVLLLPSSVYRSELAAVPDDRFRIGFGRKNMAEAVELLDRWLVGR